MKGIILAGGTGSRLNPLTKVTNKHLLPIYNKPMIFYPIELLKEAGIKDILIITGKEHAGDVFKLLGSGKDFDVKFTFKIQDEAGGIPQAISLAEDFVGSSKFVSINGDNIISGSIKKFLDGFEAGNEEMRILLYETDEENAKKGGVAVLDNENNVLEVIEKPDKPPTNWVSIGVYLLTPEVFDIIRGLKPSARGELEIADVQNIYVKRGTLKASKLDGEWADAGTIEELLKANIFASKKVFT